MSTKIEKFKITVSVRKDNSLYLREYVGEATFPSGTVVEISTVIGDGSLHFHVKGKDQSYVLRLQDVLNQIVKVEKIS